MQSERRITTEQARNIREGGGKKDDRMRDCWNFENSSSNGRREFREKEEVLDYDGEIDRQEIEIQNKEDNLEWRRYKGKRASAKIR
jgi:hypothetical protein